MPNPPLSEMVLKAQWQKPTREVFHSREAKNRRGHRYYIFFLDEERLFQGLRHNHMDAKREVRLPGASAGRKVSSQLLY